jgi:hypothetical protein
VLRDTGCGAQRLCTLLMNITKMIQDTAVYFSLSVRERLRESRAERYLKGDNQKYV